MKYETPLNPVAFKSYKKSLDEMGEKERALYLNGVFTVVSMVHGLSKGGALEKEQRLALDLFWQYLEMGITPDQFKRLGAGVAGLEVIGKK